jgi:citrate synthase
VPSIAAYAFRHSIGRPYNSPDNDLSFTGNFLNMLFKMTELKYQPNPVLARALDVLFILHADHDRTAARQRCGRSAARTSIRTRRWPARRRRSTAAPRRRERAVLRMLIEIGSVAKVPDFIKKVKSGEATTG